MVQLIFFVIALILVCLGNWILRKYISKFRGGKAAFTFSKEKSIKGTVTEDVDYKDVFPQETKCSIEVREYERGWQFIRTYEERQNKPILFNVHHATLEGDRVSPTGYTLEGIYRLGDFPDYAILSGVPLPNVYQNFNINTALPRPYRPFRWAYHQTMDKMRYTAYRSDAHSAIALTKLEPDWWIELENSYVDRIQQRVALVQKHGTDVMNMQPGSELACKELMEVAVQFTCARYPMYFILDKSRNVLENKILGTATDLKMTGPLEVLLHNIPEDFALMMRDPDTGFYHFRAGIICSSVGWNLGENIGLRLHDIHQPVPDYREKMAFSMDRYFAKMPTDAPIQRGSWSFELGEPLYLAPGDQHPSIDELGDEETEAQIHFRVDWQTLRRLPLAGAIAFKFKALFTPLKELREEALHSVIGT
jgi:hypothetical protein